MSQVGCLKGSGTVNLFTVFILTDAHDGKVTDNLYTIESKGKSIENRPIDCQDMQIFNALCSPTELADVRSKD